MASRHLTAFPACLHIDGGVNAVASLSGEHGAFAWCGIAFQRVLQSTGLSSSDLLHLISDRTITTSSSFSGIATEITAGQCIEAAAAAHIASALDSGVAPLPVPIKYKCLHCIEKSSPCQEELLHNKRGPDCLFGDIMTFCPPALQAHVDATEEFDGEFLKQLAFAEPRLAGWCVKHGRVCPLLRADQHTAGTPCTDYSNWGLRKKGQGPTAKLFAVWIALRRSLREPVLLHENVPNFGQDTLLDLLGDLYIVLSVSPVCPSAMGWPIRRPRQISLLLLKTWLYPLLED